MDRILAAFLEEPEALESRRVEQIVAICGNGTLSDASACSMLFREFLKNVPSKILKKYASECLDGNTGRNPNTGLILQDVVNEIGERLGYQVEPGFYRGKSNRIGNDGLWRMSDFAFVLEIKTSDLSIKLDTIADYRIRLIETSSLTKNDSSILIVLGRQDTGDLEAQIRGSKHAWDIRMIGLDSLFRLLDIKENLNDPRSIHQITELLKPIEYTRVDKLIDVVFNTSWDISTPENPEIPEEIEQEIELANDAAAQDSEKVLSERGTHSTPVDFYEECIIRINHKLGKQFIKSGRVKYISSDKAVHLVLLNSKPYQGGQSFWYGFRPDQSEFLSKKDSSYVAFGCGSENSIICLPYSYFKTMLTEMTTSPPRPSNIDNISHYQVRIAKNGSRYALRLPNREVYITEHLI